MSIRRLYGFRRQRRHKKWRPKGHRTSPAQRYYITPEGGALNPSGRRQPVPDRTLGAQGQSPGGAINPRPRKRASTLGNTASRRFFTKTHGFPDAKGDIKNGTEGAVPRQRSGTSYLPRARALNPSGRRQPVPDRTLGAQGQSPGGAINPRPRKRASTFGNTGKHRPGPDPYPRATSNVIITMKPRAKVRTPISECSPSDISGISSSTTTYIMAPAAKERR